MDGEDGVMRNSCIFFLKGERENFMKLNIEIIFNLSKVPKKIYFFLDLLYMNIYKKYRVT